MRILSLGAGVQSSALALMAEHGYIEPVDCAIFADTMSEPKEVYDWLEFLKSKVSFPIYVVCKGNLSKDALIVKQSNRSDNTYVKGLIPAFVLKKDGTKGLLSRKCTADYKIQPIQRKVRELLGIKRKKKGHPIADMLIGISTDEAHRMKDSRVTFIKNIYPLIELNLNREQCIEYVESRTGKTPPRSACIFCPFHGDDEWRNVIKNGNFDYAVKFEKDLQDSASRQTALKGIPYLHPSCKPLNEINFNKQEGYSQVDLFGNECEGMCGV